MDGYFYSLMKNCIDEFYSFYNQDIYISKKTLDLFLDKYRDVFQLINKFPNKSDEYYKKVVTLSQKAYNMIDVKNDNFVRNHLVRDKVYFDNMFKKVDSNIILDEEQRKAILIDEDYSLVIAGAGSGKTTTMAAKVKYMVEKRGVNPKSIIIISFTNKATEELDDILNKKFNLNVNVLTFHKLGMSFIRRIVDGPVQIVNDNGMYSIISKYFLEVVFKDKNLLKRYVNAFGEKLLKLNDYCFDYESYDEYYKHYMDEKYLDCKDNLKEEINKRIKRNQRYFKTINGEFVKSLGELKIANYLYLNSVEYEYEKKYPVTVGNLHSYSPDFTIRNFDIDVYLEFYGMASLDLYGNIIAPEDYKDVIYKKRKVHDKYDTDLIYLFGRYESGEYYLNVLGNELDKRNVRKIRRSDKEVFYRLMETSNNFPYVNLIKLIRLFINLFKEFNYSLDDFEVLSDKINDINIKEQLSLIRDVYVYYENSLRCDNRIDFQDMINYAYSNMEKLKESNINNFKYVIIDEYQDISRQRHNFAKKISDLFGAKIVAVGDDWQTIFSFSGSDIELFTKFYESMGYAEIVKITNTYRNSQELIDLAGEFVTRNKGQIFKELKSNKHLKNPVELVGYDYDVESDNLAEILSDLIVRIYNNNSNDKILLLMRFNDEMYNLIDSKLFYQKRSDSNRIYCKAQPNAYIDIMSVHKSKGLGYDQVILLNALDIVKGFPSQMRDEPVISFLKMNSFDEISDSDVMYPEERRLFYVAMTRTKNKLYIMVPNDEDFKSEFIDEIENSDAVVRV